MTYVNWVEKRKTLHVPMKLYDPFYGIHTFGCFHEDLPSDAAELSDFERAAFFGRPLFAYLAKEKLLLNQDTWRANGNETVIINPRLHAILNRMLLVSGAYARLVDFRLGSNINKAKARVCFMPDPVCAALAMGMMRKEWTLNSSNSSSGGFTGRAQDFWSISCADLFVSGICMPEKGDTGEIMAALYMLFCGDALRYKQDKTLRKFSVSLFGWYTILRSGKTPSSEPSSNGTTDGMEVNFIQVCRNYFRAHSWTTQAMLKWMYDSATATYVYPDCKAIDLVAAAYDGKRNKYYPVLVSVKCRLKMYPGEIDEGFDKIEKLLKEVRAPSYTGPKFSALCLLVLIGAEKKPNMQATKDATTEAKVKPKPQVTATTVNTTARGKQTKAELKPVSDEAKLEQDELDDEKDACNRGDLGGFPRKDAYRLIVVPDGDEFGISDAITTLNQAQEKTEISASDSFLYGERRESEAAQRLLFRKSYHKRDFMDSFTEFFMNIYSKK